MPAAGAAATPSAAAHAPQSSAAFLLVVALSAPWVAAQPAHVEAPPAPAPTLSTAQLLVDLARDHALRGGGPRTAADVLHVRTLLRAAARLDPSLGDTHAWLYELAVLSEDAESGRAALECLVRADPSHAGAFARWLDLRLAELTTPEDRIDALRALAADNRPNELQALLHTRLGDVLLQTGDRAAAGVALDRALALDADHPDALLFALKLLEPEAPHAARLRPTLRALHANPLRADLAWQVADLLAQRGDTLDAQAFFDYAVRVGESAGTTLGPEQLARLAENLVSSGQLDRARTAAQRAAATDAAPASTLFLLHWLLTRRGPSAEADALRTRLAERFAEMRDPADWSVRELADAAWFHCTIDAQPQRALMLSESAIHRAPDDPYVTRVHGWALADNLRSALAERTLMRVAGRDPFAAYRLAKLLADGGDAAAPRRIVLSLQSIPRAGPAHELLKSLGPLPTTQPARRGEDALEPLTGFDRELLSYADRLPRDVVADITPEQSNFEPADPWWATFSLTNRGSVPITLGPDGLINPVFLVSFRIDGGRERELPNLITVSLDRARVLRPGQTIRVRRTLNVGPLRRTARLNPQQLLRVTLNALLDPVELPDGRWEPTAHGQRLKPVVFNRIPAHTERAALEALYAAIDDGPPDARHLAIERCAQLLSESQRASREQLDYEPAPVSADRLYHELLTALDTSDWETRARALDALQVVGLDLAMLRAVRQCAEHPHWLVRLFALRLLARQGAGESGAFARVADKDRDALVRDLAQSYLLEWGARKPTTQPVTPAHVADPLPDRDAGTDRNPPRAGTTTP
ncbi:MAG: hypothetical protein AB7Q17_05030 [Phycisphaerae bacterium]